VDLLKKNPLKQAIREKKAAFGIYVEEASPTIVELAALAGLDFVRLDWCHGPFSPATLMNQVTAAESRGITPLVRLECNEQNVGQVLELGAMGVIIPGVSSASEARRAVDAAKFVPVGKRGLFSAARKAGFGTVSGAEFTRWTNEEVLLGIQIETLEAIENLDEILAVKGIDIVQSGRGDLSNALGVPGQKTHPRVLEAEERIFGKALSMGLAISPQLDPYAPGFEEEAAGWVEKGAYLISLGIDQAIIKKAFQSIVKKTSHLAR